MKLSKYILELTFKSFILNFLFTAKEKLLSELKEVFSKLNCSKYSLGNKEIKFLLIVFFLFFKLPSVKYNLFFLQYK